MYQNNNSKLGAAAGNVTGAILKIVAGFVLIGMIVMIGGGMYFIFELNQKPSVKEDAVPFTIERGQSFAEITDSLYTKGLIRNTFVFRLRARMLDAEGKVQAGVATIRRNMNVDQVLESITSVRLNDRQVLIREGLRLEQIANILAENGWDKDKFIRAVTQEKWEFGFLNDKPPTVSVEGFLFPDTYRIPANYTETQIVELMLRRFGEQYDPVLRQKARDNGNGIYKTVIIASLIEREAAKDDERGKISSVFFNRLKQGMKLDTDPTVQWARDTERYRQNPGFTEWWSILSKADLEIDSPYNTYKYKTLPPGPIANPGLASLRAATEPLTTDFLYFVATNDREGSHAFSKTLEEHNQNVKKYQQGG
jgi:UPF0755 protein